jgi:hypothetical protein
LAGLLSPRASLDHIGAGLPSEALQSFDHRRGWVHSRVLSPNGHHRKQPGDATSCLRYQEMSD